jgi:ABC-2 type transport system ATP-binding protein
VTTSTGDDVNRDVVTIQGLRHRYGRTLALDGVDLSVASDECVALLGPNGAGKTTLVNALVGLLRPTAGHVEIDGADPQRAQTRRHLAALHLAEGTVRNYLSSAIAKLGVRNRTEAAAIARERGWL